MRGQEGLRTTSPARGLPLPGSPRPTSLPRSCRFPRKSPGPTPPGFSSRLPARSPEFLTRQDPGSPAVSSPPSPSACSLGSRRSPSRPACQARAHSLRPDASACSLAHMAHSICPMATGEAVRLSSAGTLSPARQPPPRHLPARSSGSTPTLSPSSSGAAPPHPKFRSRSQVTGLDSKGPRLLRCSGGLLRPPEFLLAGRRGPPPHFPGANRGPHQLGCPLGARHLSCQLQAWSTWGILSIAWGSWT